MNWILTSVISAGLFSASNAITKLFQPKLSFGVGMTVFSIGVLLSSLVIAVFSKTSLTVTKVTQQAMLLALASGFIWAFAQLFFLLTLSKNAPISIAIPIIVGGIGVGGIAAGVLFYGEQLTLMRIIGAVVVLTGSVILARS